MGIPVDRYNSGDFYSGIYTPFICDLSAVTQARYPTVTTTVDHSFVVGQVVQFFVPREWGMFQLNGLKGNVLSIPADDQIVVDIDTSTFNAFVTPAPPTYVVISPAQVAGIGDNNFGTLSPGGSPVIPSIVPGSFENITA